MKYSIYQLSVKDLFACTSNAECIGVDGAYFANIISILCVNPLLAPTQPPIPYPPYSIVHQGRVPRTIGLFPLLSPAVVWGYMVIRSIPRDTDHNCTSQAWNISIPTG